MGSADGARKVAAKRVGLTVAEYQARVAAGGKWCSPCREWRPISEFPRDRTRGDGLASKCRRHGYIRIASDGPGTSERRQRAAVGERWCRGCQAWLPAADVRQGACRAHINEEVRQRYVADPAPVRARVIARKRGILPVPRDAELVWESFEGLCAYCPAIADSWDHVVPVSSGGDSTPGNVVPACRSCNSSKRNRDVWEWLESRLPRMPHEHLVEYLAMAEFG